MALQLQVERLGAKQLRKIFNGPRRFLPPALVDETRNPAGQTAGERDQRPVMAFQHGAGHA